MGKILVRNQREMDRDKKNPLLLQAAKMRAMTTTRPKTKRSQAHLAMMTMTRTQTPQGTPTTKNLIPLGQEQEPSEGLGTDHPKPSNPPTFGPPRPIGPGVQPKPKPRPKPKPNSTEHDDDDDYDSNEYGYGSGSDSNSTETEGPDANGRYNLTDYIDIECADINPDSIAIEIARCIGKEARVPIPTNKRILSSPEIGIGVLKNYFKSKKRHKGRDLYEAHPTVVVVTTTQILKKRFNHDWKFAEADVYRQSNEMTSIVFNPDEKKHFTAMYLSTDHRLLVVADKEFMIRVIDIEKSRPGKVVTPDKFSVKLDFHEPDFGIWTIARIPQTNKVIFSADRAYIHQYDLSSKERIKVDNPIDGIKFIRMVHHKIRGSGVNRKRMKKGGPNGSNGGAGPRRLPPRRRNELVHYFVATTMNELSPMNMIMDYTTWKPQRFFGLNLILSKFYSKFLKNKTVKISKI